MYTEVHDPSTRRSGNVDGSLFAPSTRYPKMLDHREDAAEMQPRGCLLNPSHPGEDQGRIVPLSFETISRPAISPSAALTPPLRAAPTLARQGGGICGRGNGALKPSGLPKPSFPRGRGLGVTLAFWLQESVDFCFRGNCRWLFGHVLGHVKSIKMGYFHGDDGAMRG